MSEIEQIPFQIEINRIIDVLAKQIYASPLALLRENCQNAYDAILQRRYMGQSFEPAINIALTPQEISIADNGIGMTTQELIDHYWKAGSSGKNNPEAKAAGVVGTFGIGAMANFGVADTLIVTSESATSCERTRCVAVRDKLSVTEKCIDMTHEQPTGQPGTTIQVKMLGDSLIDVNAATSYIADIVRHLEIPVLVNDILISEEPFENSVPKLQPEWQDVMVDAVLSPKIVANIEMIISKTGEVWFSMQNVRYEGNLLKGSMLLRQGMHQIRTFRSMFALATVAVSSVYSLGGIVNLDVLEQTAGREALTTSGLQLLQTMITECEAYISKKIALTPLADMNTSFMQWVSTHGQFDLCSNMSLRMEPENRRIRLEEIKELSAVKPFNYFEGADASIINQYATDEQPLLVISTSQPRRKCELAYLKSYCKVNRIDDIPTVLSDKAEDQWSLPESALAFRIMNIAETDYFVEIRVGYGKISHGLPILVDTRLKPIRIILDAESGSVVTMLGMYQHDYPSFTGLVKDFMRNSIFPKIASFVPSSTREGAEAFLRAIRRPRDVFEYEKNDLGTLSEIWQDYLDGKILLGEAARASTTVVRASVQIVDQATTRRVADVIPDVLENQRILEAAGQAPDTDEYEALPAITRLDKQSTAKLLLIPDDEAPFNGYRCFVAITDRVRTERGEFFLQPHQTEIVWGGQKALYIFPHHSGQFSLYYELMGMEVLADKSGGHAFRTCTIMLNNQIYVPVPDEIRAKFIPIDAGRKRFEVRCELLYPDLDVSSKDNIAKGQ